MNIDSRIRSTIDIPALLAALPARIAEIPALAAARDPQHIALIEDARRLTSAQLLQAVDAAAALLREWGVRGGDRVMIVAENSIVQIVLLFATAQARRVGAGVERAAVAQPNSTRSARTHNLVWSRMRWKAPPTPSSTRSAIRQRQAPAITPDIGAWSYSVDNTVQAEPVEAANDRQCAALIYTTGTTGAPKGVMLSHRNLLYIAAVSSRLRKVGPDDVVYAVLPISHVYGFASVCLGSLHAGATLRLAPRFSPEAVRRALADERVSIFQGVPAMHAKAARTSADARATRGPRRICALPIRAARRSTPR